jgi:hypothetical protein
MAILFFLTIFSFSTAFQTVNKICFLLIIYDLSKISFNCVLTGN